MPPSMLAHIRARRGITIIWVEHIMGVLMRVVDRCVVLDHGEVIAQGKPEQVAHDPRVIEVYLGTDAHDVQATVAARNYLMLVLTNLSAGYGSFRALFEVSLEVRAGETVAVIGPNGAGKTTLLRAISRLIDPSAGEISMEGKQLNRVPSHEVIAHGIAHVPENRRLFPRLTVEDNLRMGAFVPSARARFAERLELVYQFSRACRSGAGKQPEPSRVASSRCAPLAVRSCRGPRLLLLDEPSAGLAPVMVQSIFEAVKRMSAEGYTVLIVEQNIRQVLGIAQRGYLLETGRIKASGTSAELLATDEIKQAYLGL